MANNANIRIILSLRFFSLAIIAVLLCAGSSKAQWRAAKLPVGYENGYYLDVYFLPTNPQLGWVSGMQGRLLRTTDGGITWRGAVVPTGGDMLESVQFVTPSIGYTSGPSGIWKSVDGGITWSDITPPITAAVSFWGCFFVNQQVGLLMAGVCGGPQYFCRTTDGGITWKYFTGNEPDTKLSDAMLYSPDGVGYASSSGLIWRTDDGGRTWRVLSQTGSHVWQEEITHLGNSILVPTSGVDCDGNARNVGEMRFSTDEGLTWNRVQTQHSMFGAFLTSPYSGWGVGDDGTVIHTIDAGKTWQLVNCGLPSGVNIDDIWFINDTTGWCVGEGVYQYVPAKGTPIKIQSSKSRLCAGDSALLSAPEGYDRYVWSTGQNARTITVRGGGIFRVTAYIDAICHITSDSIEIASLPATNPILQINRPVPGLCNPGDSIIISVQNAGFTSYRWSTGETGREIVVKNEGTYFVTTIDTNGCTGMSQVMAIKKSDPYKPRIAMSRAAVFCAGDSVTLTADAGYNEYLWSSGESTRSITVKKNGDYSVTVRDANGCYGTSDSVKIVVLDLQNRLEIKSIYSEKGEFSLDSVNLGNLICRQLIIYNRDSTETVVIEQPVLLHNIRFSLRQSELPTIIPPLSEAALSICFAPTDSGLVRDTLIISDTCSPNFIPIRGYGIPIKLRGETLCEIPLQGDIFSLGKNYRVSDIFPNPTHDGFSIIYETDKTEESTVSVHLITLFGENIGKNIRKIESNNGNKKLGEIYVDTSHLTAGTYIFTISVGVYSSAMRLVVE